MSSFLRNLRLVLGVGILGGMLPACSTHLSGGDQACQIAPAPQWKVSSLILDSTQRGKTAVDLTPYLETTDTGALALQVAGDSDATSSTVTVDGTEVILAITELSNRVIPYQVVAQNSCGGSASLQLYFRVPFADSYTLDVQDDRAQHLKYREVSLENPGNGTLSIYKSSGCDAADKIAVASLVGNKLIATISADAIGNGGSIFFQLSDEETVQGQTFKFQSNCFEQTDAIHIANPICDNTSPNLITLGANSKGFCTEDQLRSVDQSILDDYELTQLADIQFSDTPLAPLGNLIRTFTGGSYWIKDLSIVDSDPTEAYSGLFRALKDNSKVERVWFKNVDLVRNGNSNWNGVGFLAGQIFATARVFDVRIEPSDSSASTITIETGGDTYSSAGALAGVNLGWAAQITAIADITLTHPSNISNTDVLGGLIGYLGPHGRLQDSEVYAKIQMGSNDNQATAGSANYIGGAIGKARGSFARVISVPRAALPASSSSQPVLGAYEDYSGAVQASDRINTNGRARSARYAVPTTLLASVPSYDSIWTGAYVEDLAPNDDTTGFDASFTFFHDFGFGSLWDTAWMIGWEGNTYFPGTLFLSTKPSVAHAEIETSSLVPRPYLEHPVEFDQSYAIAASGSGVVINLPLLPQVYGYPHTSWTGVTLEQVTDGGCVDDNLVTLSPSVGDSMAESSTFGFTLDVAPGAMNSDQFLCFRANQDGVTSETMAMHLTIGASGLVSPLSDLSNMLNTLDDN